VHATSRVAIAASRWRWRHAVAPNAWLALALAGMSTVLAGLCALLGLRGFAIGAYVVALGSLPALYFLTPPDIRHWVRRRVAGSRCVIVLSEDETAFLLIVRIVSKGRGYWFLGHHAALGVGEGQGAALRARLRGPLLAQADAQGIVIAAVVPVRLEAQLLHELPGARGSGPFFFRQLEREPAGVRTPSPSA